MSFEWWLSWFIHMGLERAVLRHIAARLGACSEEKSVTGNTSLLAGFV
jgi:hypothetical protein